jgi:hypothetical protein
MKLRLSNFGRYLPVFWQVFPVFLKTRFSAACRYFFPNEKKILACNTKNISYLLRNPMNNKEVG